MEPQQRTRWQLLTAAVLSVIGFALSVYLTWQHLHVLKTGAASVCNFGGTWNCDLVSNGPYSELYGVPISHFGTLFYTAAAALSILGLLRASFSRVAHALLFLMSILSVLSSIALFGLSALVIRAFCLFCIGLYVVGFAFLLTTFRGAADALCGLQGVTHRLSVLARAKNAADSGQNRSFVLLLCLVAATFAALGSMLMLRQMVQSQHAANRLVERELQRIRQVAVAQPGLPALFTDSLPVQGPKEAPVTLVEVSDFACPFCQKTANTIEDLRRIYATKIRIAFRHFPLDQACNPHVLRQVHPNACLLAKRAHCAHLQGKFFDLAHQLFEGAAQEPDLQPVLHELRLDEGLFHRCLQDPKTDLAIATDINVAKQHGVYAVPMVFVNGHLVKGAQPLEVYRAIIDEELAKIGR